MRGDIDRIVEPDIVRDPRIYIIIRNFKPNHAHPLSDGYTRGGIRQGDDPGHDYDVRLSTDIPHPVGEGGSIRIRV